MFGDFVSTGNSKSVVVIGAGPAGLAASVRLGELGLQNTVVEASNRVGGMAGSLNLWGHTVDLGPHRFFSADPVVTDFWHRYMRDDYVLVSRQTRIYYRNRFFDYPLKAGNALKNLGAFRAVAAIGSYSRARIQPVKDDGSLESWVSNRFGRVLFETFFKTYTEKLWGVSCKELDADWAAQRIQGLTLWGAVKSAFSGNRGNKLKTLVDEFAYPTRGNLAFYQALEDATTRMGNEVLTQASVQKLNVVGNSVTGVTLKDGKVIDSEWVISSMPITLLLAGISDVPSEVRVAAERLRFRNTVLVYLLVESDELFPDQWLYVHDQNVKHGRITNFRNWSKEIVGDDGNTVVCLEYWCFDEDPLWSQNEEELVEIAAREFISTGLADGH